MTTENQVDATSNGEGTEPKADPVAEVSKLQKLLEQTTAERDKLRVQNRELKQTTGSAEDIKKQLDDLLAEKSKLIEEFEGYKGKIKAEKLDTRLSTALKEAGAKSITAAMKLLDRSKIEFGDDDQVNDDSLKAAIGELVKSEPVLFGTEDEGSKAQKPGVQPKPAADKTSDVKSYEEEIRAAKTIKEITAVMKKYGKA